jgi:hypothetical protein
VSLSLRAGGLNLNEMTKMLPPTCLIPEG